MKYLITDDRILPEHMTPSSEGANSVDLRACIKESLRIRPGDQYIIPCGIKVELFLNTMGMLLPRSGKGVGGLVLGNLVGNIDADYRGEVKACLWNRGNTDHIIQPLERIAQFVVVPVVQPSHWTQADSLSDTDRGEGGFGSTGSS